MKKLNGIGGVLLAMAIVLGSAQVAMSDTAMSVKGGDRPSANPSERYLKVLAEVSYISTLATTNCYAFMDYMTDSAKSSARAFSRKMLLDDKQYFLPDFCKVKYVVVGGLDEKGYVAGFYNPFYDTWFMFRVVDAKKTLIDGFKVVPGAYFEGVPMKGYPAASGNPSAEEYLKGVFTQVKSALFSMRDWFSGKNYRALFDQMPESDDKLVGYLSELLKFRIGQMLKVSDDNRVFGDAVACNIIIQKGDTSRFVAEDPSTKLTVKTLAGALKDLRSGFKFVAYFPSGDETNLLYNHRLIPTLLIHANVSKDGKVWMRMFDAHSVTKDIK